MLPIVHYNYWALLSRKTLSKKPKTVHHGTAFGIQILCKDFEPIYWEHIQEIIEHEKPEGIVVQLGGQTALKLAEKFHAEGIKIIGTQFPDMDLAEDRGSFSDLLKELDIPYPKYGVADTADDAIEIANRVNYPVLVRPSYVMTSRSIAYLLILRTQHITRRS